MTVGGLMRWWLTLQQGGLSSDYAPPPPECPSGSTVDENGAVSRFDITVCFCDTPSDRSGENPYESGVTITLNGDPWTVDSAQLNPGTDCVTFTGLEPISSTDAILFNFDYSASAWDSPTEDVVDLVVSNLIPAPVELLTLPAFDATTGRLDLGDFYNTRTTSETFVDHEGIVRSVPTLFMIYAGARIVRNLVSYTADLSHSDWTKSNTSITTGISDPDGGNNACTITATANNGTCYQDAVPDISIGRTYLNSTWIRRRTGSGTIYMHDGATYALISITTDWQRLVTDKQTETDTHAYIGWKLTTSGDEIDIYCPQMEDVTAQADQDIPGEYESVGVGIGDELLSNGGFDSDLSDWTYNASYFSWSAGTLVVNAPDTTKRPCEQNFTTQAGRLYVIELVVASVTSGSLEVTIDGTGTFEIDDVAAAGTYYATFTAVSASSKITMQNNGVATQAAVDSISVKLATTGYGIYNRENGNTVNGSGVVTDTPGSVLATEPVMRHAPSAINALFPSVPDDGETYWHARGDAAIVNNGTYSSFTDISTQSTHDIYRYTNVGAFSNSVRIEPSFWMKAITTTGTLRLHAATATGDWNIDMSQVSTTDFEYITRDHPAVSVVAEFMSDGTGQGALWFYAQSGGPFDFDIKGVQLEQGTVSTPTIQTTTGPGTRAIDAILHPYSASVFDNDEGTLYLEFILDRSTDSLNGTPSFSFFALDSAYGADDQVALHFTTHSSIFMSDATIHASAAANFTNIAAGNTIKVVVSWSVELDILRIGVKGLGSYQWSSDESYTAFTLNALIGLMINSPAVTEIVDMQVLGSYSTKAYAAARYN